MNSRFYLDMYTRAIKDHKKEHYELTIAVNIIERWKLTTLEGFQLGDFQALLKYMGIY